MSSNVIERKPSWYIRCVNSWATLRNRSRLTIYELILALGIVGIMVQRTKFGKASAMLSEVIEQKPFCEVVK